MYTNFVNQARELFFSHRGKDLLRIYHRRKMLWFSMYWGRPIKQVLYGDRPWIPFLICHPLHYLDGKKKLKDQNGILRGQIFQRPAKCAENWSSAAARRSAAEGASALNYSLNAVNSALALASKCLMLIDEMIIVSLIMIWNINKDCMLC